LSLRVRLCIWLNHLKFRWLFDGNQGLINNRTPASDESFLFQLPNPLLQELPLRFCWVSAKAFS
jgi:hypothetical protein